MAKQKKTVTISLNEEEVEDLIRLMFLGSWMSGAYDANPFAIDAAWLAGRTTKGPVTFRPNLQIGAASFAPNDSTGYAINEAQYESRFDLSMSVKF